MFATVVVRTYVPAYRRACVRAGVRALGACLTFTPRLSRLDSHNLPVISLLSRVSSVAVISSNLDHADPNTNWLVKEIYIQSNDKRK